MASLGDYLFDQTTQVALIKEYSDDIGEGDTEKTTISRALAAVATSQVPKPLDLTWCVLCIMYVSADEIYARIRETTPPSIIRGWFGTPEQYRKRMERQLCGVFAAADRGRGRRGRVISKCMTPVEIVSAAWSDFVFEYTTPSDITATKNNWAQAEK